MIPGAKHLESLTFDSHVDDEAKEGNGVTNLPHDPLWEPNHLVIDLAIATGFMMNRRDME
jgi:hypothetical protein